MIQKLKELVNSKHIRLSSSKLVATHSASPPALFLVSYSPLASRVLSRDPKTLCRSGASWPHRHCPPRSTPRHGLLRRSGLLSGSFGHCCSSLQPTLLSAIFSRALQGSGWTEGRRLSSLAETAMGHPILPQPVPSGSLVVPRPYRPEPEPVL